MQAHTLTICAYAAGLVTTLALASVFTPARWWRRPNARAGAILAGGTWGIGALLLLLLQPMTTADAASTAASDGVQAITSWPPTARHTASQHPPISRHSQHPPLSPDSQITPSNALKSGAQYRVYQSLNLRAAAGTNASRVAVVPVGALVTASGVRDGDWWQLNAIVDGRPLQGWASSLWLRRLDEGKSDLRNRQKD